jgi:hypothetical protein
MPSPSPIHRKVTGWGEGGGGMHPLLHKGRYELYMKANKQPSIY